MRRGIKAGDLGDPGTPLTDRRPACSDIATERAHQPEPGHRHPPSFELIAAHPESLGTEAGKHVSSGGQIRVQTPVAVDAQPAGLYHPVMSLRIIVGILALLIAGSACNNKRVRVPAADELYARGAIAHDDESYEVAIREYRFSFPTYAPDQRRSGSD